MEHNSILRPFNALKDQTQLKPIFLPCDRQTGLVDPADIRSAITDQTKLIACVHVSNVTGTMQPVDKVAAIAAEAGIPCVIDAAQSIGHVPIDVQEWGADFVAFPGHKGLLGPLGTGVLYIKPGVENSLPTMKEGGTGSISELAVQPDFMPDKYEIGSHNAIGLAGLSESVAWVIEKGVENIRAHDVELCKLFLDGTSDVPNLTVLGPRDTTVRCGVFSVVIDTLTPGDLAAKLEKDFGILTRPGIHCAPLAHKTIGTHPTGTTRLSFGPHTTKEHIRQAVDALKKIAAN